MTRMEPNDTFDDFDTQIQCDELIPDGYEDRDDDYGHGEDCPVDIDGNYDADGYYGDPAGDPDELPYGWDVEQEEFPW